MHLCTCSTHSPSFPVLSVEHHLCLLWKPHFCSVDTSYCITLILASIFLFLIHITIKGISVWPLHPGVYLPCSSSSLWDSHHCSLLPFPLVALSTTSHFSSVLKIFLTLNMKEKYTFLWNYLNSLSIITSNSTIHLQMTQFHSLPVHSEYTPHFPYPFIHQWAPKQIW